MRKIDYQYEMDFWPVSFHQNPLGQRFTPPLVGPAYLSDIQDWESGSEVHRFTIGRDLTGRYFVAVEPRKIAGESESVPSLAPTTVYWFSRFVHAEAKFRLLVDAFAPCEDSYASLGLDNPATEMEAELREERA
jgi:hypothetical protein